MGFLGGLFTVPGSSAMNSALGGLEGQATLNAGLQSQYEPAAFQSLWNQANNPNPSTADLSQFRSLAAAGMTATQGAQQKAMAGLYNRGQLVNGQPSSSFGGGALNNLWNGYTRGLMGAQQNMDATAQARQQQALSSVLGASMSAGGAATSDYQAQYQIGANQANQFIQGLTGLGAGAAGLWKMLAPAGGA